MTDEPLPQEIYCQQCGKLIGSGSKKKRLYCSETCKRAAYQQRRLLREGRQPRPRRPKPPEALPDFSQAAAPQLNPAEQRKAARRKRIQQARLRTIAVLLAALMLFFLLAWLTWGQ